jgi:hypothetical protein
MNGQCDTRGAGDRFTCVPNPHGFHTHLGGISASFYVFQPLSPSDVQTLVRSDASETPPRSFHSGFGGFVRQNEGTGSKFG